MAANFKALQSSFVSNTRTKTTLKVEGHFISHNEVELHIQLGHVPQTLRGGTLKYSGKHSSHNEVTVWLSLEG